MKNALHIGVALRISLQNARIRLGRSAITASGIALGIAFFTFVRASAVLSPGAADTESISRQTWLSAVSLIMCAVGIMNAMLMAVAERYKEIGAMKCLGATDRFIVLLFFLESGLLGIVGSLAGFLFGASMAVGVVAFRVGLAPGWPMALAGLLLTAVGIGAALTVIATLLPAYRAAKMPASAALRVEV